MMENKWKSKDLCSTTASSYQSCTNDSIKSSTLSSCNDMTNRASLVLLDQDPLITNVSNITPSGVDTSNYHKTKNGDIISDIQHINVL